MKRTRIYRNVGYSIRSPWKFLLRGGCAQAGTNGLDGQGPQLRRTWQSGLTGLCLHLWRWSAPALRSSGWGLSEHLRLLSGYKWNVHSAKLCSKVNPKSDAYIHTFMIRMAPSWIGVVIWLRGNSAKPGVKETQTDAALVFLCALSTFSSTLLSRYNEQPTRLDLSKSFRLFETNKVELNITGS